MEKVKHYFASYTDSKECFETSDGYLFHRATDAAAHAQILDNKRVKPYTREEVEALTAPEQTAQTANDDTDKGSFDGMAKEETPTEEEPNSEVPQIGNVAEDGIGAKVAPLEEEAAPAQAQTKGKKGSTKK
jgi:hypothetical protein